MQALERDRADRGLDHAAQNARDALRGLIPDVPVALMTDELARLDYEATLAEQSATLAEQSATLAEQSATLAEQSAGYRVN